MTRMIKLLCFVITLFSVAASVSWYLQSKKAGEGDSPKAPDERAVKPGHGPGSAGTPKHGATGAPTPRPLIRPATTQEAERITQMASALQQQQETLKGREQQLAQREKQIEAIHEQIKKEQKRFDVIRKEIQAELVLVQEKIELMEKRAAEGDRDRKAVETQREELKKSITELGGVEAKNLKQLALIYDKMDSEAASQSIHQMVETGKLDMAVTILTNMRERQAAGLLGEIARQDPSAAVQLFDRMRLVKTPAPPAPK